MSEIHNSSIDILINNIKSQRKIRGWNQSDLAKETGVDQSYISRLEKGGRNVTLDFIDKVSTAFGIQTYELLQHDRIDELSLREKVAEVEKLDPLKKMMVEQMIDAFLKEKQAKI